MATKTLLRLLLALVAAGVVAAILHFAGSGGGVSKVGPSTSKKKVFDDFPLNDVAKIAISGNDGAVTLSRGGETWEIAERDGYPANADPIVNLLRTVWDLNVAQPVTIGRTQYGRLSLLDPADEATSADDAATVIAFSSAEGDELASLWLGKVHERSEGRPDPFGGGMARTDAGRYVRRGDSHSVFLVGETFSNIQTDPTRWLDKSFFRVEKLKSIEISTGEAGDDWKLERSDEAGDFTLVAAKDGEKLDPTKVSTMKGAFSNPQIEDVIVGDEAKEQKTDFATFKIETFDGFRYEISVGEKNDLNELPLVLKVSAELPETREVGEEESDEEKERLDKEFESRLETLKSKLADEKKLEGHVFRVRSYVVDSLIKKRSELLEEKKEDESVSTEEVAPGVSLPLPGAPSAPAAPSAPSAAEESPAPAPASAGKAKAPAKGKAKAKGEKAPAPATDKAEAKAAEPKEDAKPAPEPKPEEPKSESEPKAEEKPKPKPSAEPEPEPEPEAEKPSAPAPESADGGES